MDSIKQQHQRQAKRENDLGQHCCCQRSRKLKYNTKFLGNQKVAQVRATWSLNYTTFLWLSTTLQCSPWLWMNTCYASCLHRCRRRLSIRRSNVCWQSFEAKLPLQKAIREKGVRWVGSHLSTGSGGPLCLQCNCKIVLNFATVNSFYMVRVLQKCSLRQPNSPPPKRLPPPASVWSVSSLDRTFSKKTWLPACSVVGELQYTFSHMIGYLRSVMY